MYYEVIIGQGVKVTTAIHVFELKGKHSISHNYSSYWISDLIFDCHMVIFKDTDEGKLLTNMIERQAQLDSILEWLNHTLLKNMDPAKIMLAIEGERDKAFDDGKRAKAAEIREALYL